MAERQNPLLAPPFIEQMVWPVLQKILKDNPNVNAHAFCIFYEDHTNTSVPPAIWKEWLKHLGLSPERKTVWVQNPDPEVLARLQTQTTTPPTEPRLRLAGEPKTGPEGSPRVQKPRIMEDLSMMTATEQSLAAAVFGAAGAAGQVDPSTDGFRFDNEEDPNAAGAGSQP